VTLLELYTQQRRSMVFKVYPYVHNYEVAEDLVQDAFTRAFSIISQYDERRGSIKGWFVKILFSCLWNYKRQQKKQVITYHIDSVSENDLLSYEEEPDIREYLMSVSNPKHRKALVASILLGHTYSEAASIAELSEANVRKVVQRFREKENG